ncbi:MAG: hypothetical protein JWM12_2992 [Ilumatobacteraceae bacterium]|nr:hypothetical protein [Ilumatobacteraceae bacterium]
MTRPLTAGLVCAVCGAHVDIATPCAWSCPNATATDRRHALAFVHNDAAVQRLAGASPFVAFRPHLAWDSFAAANGMSELARNALVAELEGQIAAHAVGGFRVTPFARAGRLSTELGFAAGGGVWVKDETGQVGGSHKARHLFTILLHIRAAEVLGLAPWDDAEQRWPLAIASCGNAAIAAATLAEAVGWPIQVFVPPTADAPVVGLLEALGAHVVVCPRRPADPPGDPCVLRFREAVAAGAVPFSVQGTENAWGLDGGRTIGWEMATQFADDGDGEPLDRVFVQVGGGALAACVAQGLDAAGEPARLHAVQTESCAPLARAWDRAAPSDRARPASRWQDLMWPWADVERSAADGILDDETYDWIPVVEAMSRSGGRPVVVSEVQIAGAHELVHRTTEIDASATATAGVAGLLAMRDEIGPDERVAVILSGIARR